jgi:hypothetical protein
MSWASLASNQTISFNNLQNAVNNGVFTAKTAIPVSNEQITKADANTYVNINTSFGPYAAKASNQLVVKSNLEAVITSYAHTIYYYSTCYWDGLYLEAGAPSASIACSSNAFSITLYSADFALGNGSYLYTDSGLTNFWYWDELCGGAPGYFKTGDYSFRYFPPSIEQNPEIQDYTLCAGQTSYLYGFCGVSNVSPGAACSDAVSNQRVLYSECPSPLTAGCSLFYSPNLTSPVTELYVFAEANWDMNGSGVISSFSPIQC